MTNYIGGISDSYNRGDHFDKLDSTSEVIGNLSSIPYYITWIGQKYNYACSILADTFLSKYLGKIIAHTIPMSTVQNLTYALGGIGLGMGAAFTVKESVSLVRQFTLLNLFEKKSLGRTLLVIAERHRENPLLLERSLPEWLYNDLIEKAKNLARPEVRINLYSDKTSVQQKAREEVSRLISDYLKDLVEKIDEGATAEATQLVSNMHSYAIKKAVFHALAIAGLILGLVSTLGFFIAFPPALGIALLVGIGLAVTAKLLILYGVVENRDGGFSFFNLLPQFIKTKVNHSNNLQQMNSYYSLMPSYQAVPTE